MASCLLGRRDGLMFCDHHAAGMDWEGLLGEVGGLVGGGGRTFEHWYENAPWCDSKV